MQRDKSTFGKWWAHNHTMGITDITLSNICTFPIKQWIFTIKIKKKIPKKAKNPQKPQSLQHQVNLYKYFKLSLFFTKVISSVLHPSVTDNSGASGIPRHADCSWPGDGPCKHSSLWLDMRRSHRKNSYTPWSCKHALAHAAGRQKGMRRGWKKKLTNSWPDPCPCLKNADERG